MKTFINGYAITAPFGSIDPSHPIPHKGLDLAMPMGTPVTCINDGVVTAITDEGNVSFGKAVHIRLVDGTDATYAHLSEFKVRVGQHVHAGDVIALSGNTGDSTGPHLHIQLVNHGTVIDPMQYSGMPVTHHSFMDAITGFWDVWTDANKYGWWHALTGQTFGPWLDQRIDVAAITVAMVAALIGLMGAKIGWKVVYWTFGIYFVIRLAYYYMGA